MNIETKFNLGDRFYAIGCNQYMGKEVCKACSGEGHINLNDGDTTECPKCWGKGYNETYGKKNWHLITAEEGDPMFQVPISKIDVEVVGGKRKQILKISYSSKGFGNYFYEDDCFATIEEAQKECDKRNEFDVKEA